MLIVQKYSYALFISLCITISYFLGAGDINLLLVGLMAISPLMLLIGKIRIDRTAMLFLSYIALLFLINLYHYDNFRPSSFIYTGSFIFSFLVLRDCINKNFMDLRHATILLKIIIYSYAVVLFLQQVCVLTGLPVINVSYNTTGNEWKLPSLAPEPSHLVRFMFFFMYSYISLKEYYIGRRYNFNDFCTEKFVWFSYFWVMTTCVSSTGFLLVLLLFLKFISKKSLIKFFVIFCIVGIFLPVIIGNNEIAKRAFDFVTALTTFDFAKIDSTDHSAAYRIVPFYAFFDNMDLLNSNFYLGYGMDYGKTICQNYMVFRGVGETSYIENDVRVGGMMAVVMDYGIISFSILILAIKSILTLIKDKMLVIIWCILSFVEGINMQMFWCSLTLMIFISHFNINIYKKNGSKH